MDPADARACVTLTSVDTVLLQDKFAASLITAELERRYTSAVVDVVRETRDEARALRGEAVASRRGSATRRAVRRVLPEPPLGRP